MLTSIIAQHYYTLIYSHVVVKTLFNNSIRTSMFRIVNPSIYIIVLLFWCLGTATSYSNETFKHFLKMKIKQRVLPNSINQCNVLCLKIDGRILERKAHEIQMIFLRLYVPRRNKHYNHITDEMLIRITPNYSVTTIC